MAKRLNADSAAKQVTEALQPVNDFCVTTAHDSRQEPPARKPLPAELARALGQTER
ncbi:hypothetical protein ABID65_002208 [Bradyrhizobium sp. S3.9.2]|uniref:hypothetical protein n=1 Tax=Bradyrhizobium sp. S3.9.2 TaxID=3156432 RepID=UPI0033971FE3